ncbi:MAG: TolC family protein [Cyanobacteriota bacterium]|nr:TolC family protein [Cyanobacteriota bacterium]
MKDQASYKFQGLKPLFALLCCFWSGPAIARSVEGSPEFAEIRSYYCSRESQGEVYNSLANNVEPASELLKILSEEEELLSIPSPTEQLPETRYFEVDLEEAMEIALGRNRQLQIEEIKLHQQRRTLQAERSRLYPSLSLDGDAERSGLGIENSSLSDARDESYEQLNATILGAELELNYTAIDGERSARIQEEKLELQSAKLDLAIAKEDLRLDVYREYYDLQEAIALSEIELDAVVTSCRALNIAESKLEEEDADEEDQLDVIQARIELADDIEDFLESITLGQKAYYNLARQLGLPINLLVRPTANIAPIGRWALSLEGSIVLALNHRDELEKILLERLADRARKKIEIAAVRPTLSLDASTGIVKVFSDTYEWFPDSAANEDSFEWNYSIGLELNWTFFDGGRARARIGRARLAVLREEIEFARSRDDIRQEVVDAYSDFEENRLSLPIVESKTEQAFNAAERAQALFEAGEVSGNTAINAREDLNEAKRDRVRTILDYNRALAELRRAAGTNIDERIFGS